MTGSLADSRNGVPLRVAIVGAGRIVERVYLPLLAEQRAATLDAVFDIDTDRAARVAGQMQATGLPHARGADWKAPRRGDCRLAQPPPRGNCGRGIVGRLPCTVREAHGPR